ncbi:hypothetical protein RNJ44_01065 [Nakaseomyces bracarensis]|uniref:TEL2-interacting protein 1 n=1 Tax=Nakaseomyces bracarensis TaxID=273131 RepID=A0ABR4NR30_9SACH
MSEDSNAVFATLRTPCIKLSTITFLPAESFGASTIELQEALVNLRDVLRDLSEETDLSSKLGDYVFVPIANLLKQPDLSNLTIEYVLEVLEQILKLFWYRNDCLEENVAKQLFQIITFLIGGDKDNRALTEKTTDFKLVSVKLLRQFFDSLSNQRYSTQFFKDDIRNLSVMSHSVTICLDILKSEPYIVECQLEALDSLEILYSRILLDGETLSYILPGNISSISIVLSKSGLQTHSKVIVKGLRVLSIILTSVYNDEDLRTSIASFENIWKLVSKELSSTPDNPIERENIDNNLIIKEVSPMKVHRDISWLRGTSSQVKIALTAFLPKLTKREVSSIRTAVIDFIEVLLKKSSNSLLKCHDILLQSLVQIQSNPDNILNKHSNRLISSTEELIGKIPNIKIDEIDVLLGQLEFSLLVLKSTNDCAVLVSESISALYSYLLTELRNFSSRKTSTKIVEHKSDIILAEEWDNGDVIKKNSFPEVFGSEEKHIRHFLKGISQIMSPNEEYFNDILNELISTTDSDSIIDKTMALWFCNNLMVGSAHKNSNNDLFLTFEESSPGGKNGGIISYPNSAFEILEYAKSFYESIELGIEYRSPDRIQEMAICTTLSTIETVANVMKTDFADELIDYLYVIIDNLASPSAVIREFSQNCAITVAKILYQGSVSEMIKNNVDYIIDSISLRLNSGMTQRVSMVLMVVCKLAGYESIINFKDVIEMLFKMLDYYHGYSEICVQFFQVFEVIIIEMKKKYLRDSNRKAIKYHLDNRSTFSPWGMDSIHAVVDFLQHEVKSSETLPLDMDEDAALEEVDNFKDYVANKMNTPDSDDEDEIVDDVEAIDDEIPNGDDPKKKKDLEEWNSPIPLQSYRILLQIASYGDRLLTHPSKDLRIQILRVLSLTWPMLATQYSSMLPQIAQSWDAVTNCILDNNYVIVDAASICTKIMIQYSGDFISKRFIDLWKVIKKSSSIIKEVRITTLDGNLGIDTRILVEGSYKFPTITKKALISLSEMIIEGILCTELLLSDTDIFEMINCCMKVLTRDKIAEKSFYLGDVVYQISTEL